jgi:two-component system nitrogen regulation response regulator NtrX
MKDKSSEILTALIIDDEPSICQSLSAVIGDEGWNSNSAYSGVEGVRRFRAQRPDLVFLDVWMRGIDGIETLQRLREINQEIPIVIMSGHGSIEAAVRVTKLGAFDFLEKPLSIERIIPILEHARIRKAQRTGGLDHFGREMDLIGESQPIIETRRQIEVVAPRNAWVLITGENGTGKEIVAQNIHSKSPRAAKPFVAINCAAIPEELIESELFGHAKGAFTNAFGAKKGKFELANQGTLFLDEIADMSLRTQAKILRILQERQFERIGEETTVTVDVRVIAATNKDLEAQIASGAFREDLFYRLNVVPFKLAPLRERGRDVILLANFFLRKMATEFGEPQKQLTEEAEDALLNYSWPGNVRELKNIVERISVLQEGRLIERNNLPQQILVQANNSGAQLNAAATLREARNEFEKQFILEKLEEHQWNVSKTADAIGLERSNLHRKIKAFDIDTKKIRGD